MHTCIKEPLPLFNKDFDPYVELVSLREDLSVVAGHMETLTEQLKHHSWMMEQITTGYSQIARAIGILHDRLEKLELQNEKK